ncbi:four helix bundle protein [Christiangramia sabulilitoris]|nr:four helix bundle protein [Christiangramia sabulilitoris]
MQDLKKRTKTFALECWNLCRLIPKTRECDAIVRQLIRSSSSVAANYRAANRAKSDRDFINKLKIVEEEADESQFWLEFLFETFENNHEEIQRLIKESDELIAISVASIKKVKARI